MLTSPYDKVVQPFTVYNAMNAQNFAYLSQAIPKKLTAIAIVVLMLALIGYQSVSFFQPIVIPATKLQSVNSHINPSRQAINSKSALFSMALFGDYIPNLSDSEIKQSTLDVELVGILYSPDEKKSQVLIQGVDKEEHAYLIDDKLPGGAVIKRISKNGIVVLYNGTLERLSLRKNELIFDEPAKPLSLEKE